LEGKAQQREDLARTTIAAIYRKEGCKARKGKDEAGKWHPQSVQYFPHIERPDFKKKNKNKTKQVCLGFFFF